MNINFINYLEYLEQDPLAAPEEYRFAQDIRKLMAVVEAAKLFLYHADYHGEYGRSLNGHHESWKNIHETLEALEKE